jgi:hypothetical protein
MKLQSNENVDRHIHRTHTSDAADSSDHDPSFRCQVPSRYLARGIIKRDEKALEGHRFVYHDRNGSSFRVIDRQVIHLLEAV